MRLLLWLNSLSISHSIRENNLLSFPLAWSLSHIFQHDHFKYGAISCMQTMIFWVISKLAHTFLQLIVASCHVFVRSQAKPLWGILRIQTDIKNGRQIAQWQLGVDSDSCIFHHTRRLPIVNLPCLLTQLTTFSSTYLLQRGVLLCKLKLLLLPVSCCPNWTWGPFFKVLIQNSHLVVILIFTIEDCRRFIAPLVCPSFTAALGLCIFDGLFHSHYKSHVVRLIWGGVSLTIVAPRHYHRIWHVDLEHDLRLMHKRLCDLTLLIFESLWGTLLLSLKLPKILCLVFSILCLHLGVYACGVQVVGILAAWQKAHYGWRALTYWWLV